VPSFSFHLNNRFRKERPSRPQTAVSATSNGTQHPAEAFGLGMWSAPPPQNTPRPRPTTIHESSFSFCMPEAFQPLPAWDSSTMPSHTQGIMAQTYAVQHDFYPPLGVDSSTSPKMTLSLVTYLVTDTWTTKACDENVEMQILDSDMTIGQALTTDEHVPILDLGYHGSGSDQEQLNHDVQFNGRRLSGSSFTLSTTGGLSEMPSYDDFSTTLSEAPSFTSDYPPPSNRNSLMSSTHLSPVASPRMTPQNRSELVRTQSRGRASPSPRPSMRSAPYSMDSARNKRWSTGSYAPVRRPSPFVYHAAPEYFTSHPQRTSSRHSSPPLPDNPLPLNMNNLQTQQNPFPTSNNTGYQRNSMLHPSQTYQETHFENPPPLLSHGLFRMLQSNADSHALHSHYTDLSDPPDLYASLNEEQVPPPPEDMNPSDPDLIPHEQELRFDGDLYTPRWVRGHGNKREGWCGICKPGRWLVLKNSAFWYDKSFTHGISAATGSAFQEPQEARRMDGNPDVWEGLCGSCNEWVALVSSKKKGTTWFRHAYKVSSLSYF
jgi:Domain of unknown function (DUF4451)